LVAYATSALSLITEKKLDLRASASIFLGFKPHTKKGILHLIFPQSFPSFHVHSYPTIYDYGKDLVCSSPFSHSNILDDSQSNMSVDHSQLDSSNTSSNPLNSPIIVPPRRSNRDRTRPKKFQDFHTTFTLAVTGQSSGIHYPLAYVLSYKNLSPTYHSFIMVVSSETEPKSFKEASQSDKWIKAMNVGIKALEANYTWILTDLPPNKSAIECKWVYKIKHKTDGSVERYKASLVTKGYTQIEGQDYLNTFFTSGQDNYCEIVACFSCY